ncbi:DUF4350 domain-containing protein [Idiomarina aminovorans]|uniref:DUF4350 domain-containing protein n=1 Tax=Idiomarina aminovorans TaxID=2914829 RepID=UPI002003D9C2|nr:DUF4350 domain-containing protein [Idiomarina sp. ATCH4]MCK7460225.1 DUF4350 domain-containing protein [Idiomarina sp. ATCH4]
MNLLSKLIFLCLVLAISACSESSQQADPDFQPRGNKTSMTSDANTVVVVDEAHNNFLTISGRYKPFEQVLSNNGYKVRSNTRSFTSDRLNKADILVIANALDRNRSDWQPPFGRALDDDEVDNIKKWVSDGGSLFLIADHTPFPKVVENLALAFGFEFSNGHVGSYVFRSADNTLADHPITTGASNNSSREPLMPVPTKALNEKSPSFGQVTQVKTFGGSAFKAPDEATSLLTIGQGAVSIEPLIPFQVTSSTPRISMNGWSQGAVLKFEKGRVAVFSEGMMFSSQLDLKTGKKYGLRAVGAEQNEQFLINIIFWLSSTD